MMGKLNPIEQDDLQKSDDVSSRDLCKELPYSVNIKVPGSGALVESAVKQKVLDSDTTAAGVTKWRGFVNKG